MLMGGARGGIHSILDARAINLRYGAGAPETAQRPSPSDAGILSGLLILDTVPKHSRACDRYLSDAGSPKASACAESTLGHAPRHG